MTPAPPPHTAASCTPSHVPQHRMPRPSARGAVCICIQCYRPWHTMFLPLAYNVFAISIQWYCLWHTMILPVAYDVFVNQVSSFMPKRYICQWTQSGAAATARRVRVLSTAGHALRKRCYRHLVCCMTGLGYNPHTFSIIHNQPKAPLEDEGREDML